MAECLECGHSAPPTCGTCGGLNGYGDTLNPCPNCMARKNPPVSELPPPIGGTQPPQPPPQPLNLPATDSGESSGEWRGITIDDV